MNEPAADSVRANLLRATQGDQRCAELLFPAVYDELRRLAQNHLRGHKHHQSLQATGLVHEAFLRLVGTEEVAWKDRAHFFAIASRAMRHFLSNYARERGAQKRGGEVARVTLGDVIEPGLDSGVDLESLSRALDRLRELDERQARIVEMRFFADMTNEEIGEVLKISPSTAKREWRMARAWLTAELTEG